MSRPLRSRVEPNRKLDPAIGAAMVLVGCLLTFYLVGFLIIPVGAWLWRRALQA